MREPGLECAIAAAGGVAALARVLGIRQPSVSSWRRVPADRVVAIEQSTGVAREQLRPDLYRTGENALAEADSMPEIVDDIELARAQQYLLLASLLRRTPTRALLDDISRLTGDGSALGLARIALAEAAPEVDEKAVAEEFFALFIGIGRGELLPYASFYLTGFLNERPLAAVREELGRLGIERADGNFDPEDHLGLLLEIMGGFAKGTFDGDLDVQRAFYRRHVMPWAQRFLSDLGVAPSARFYKPVARFGREFLAVEQEAFDIEE